ncbi:hypothetical protein ACU686_21475 [Yinghuangia aomiensis]
MLAKYSRDRVKVLTRTINSGEMRGTAERRHRLRTRQPWVAYLDSDDVTPPRSHRRPAGRRARRRLRRTSPPASASAGNSRPD